MKKIEKSALISKKSRFFEDVYELVNLVPKGRVTTYGLIAEYLGAKSGARMVGWAMNQAHFISDVPAHRVVNRKGLLTGKNHFESPNRMQELLKSEGIDIKNDQIIDFESVVWSPKIELL